MIINTNLKKEYSLTEEDPIGKNIDEFISPGDVKHYMECLNSAIKNGYECCSYEIAGHIFMARFKKISSLRIRVIERDVTDLSLQEALRLF